MGWDFWILGFIQYLCTYYHFIYFLINQGQAKSNLPFAQSYLPTLFHFVLFYLRYLPTQTLDVLYECSQTQMPAFNKFMVMSSLPYNKTSKPLAFRNDSRGNFSGRGINILISEDIFTLLSSSKKLTKLLYSTFRLIWYLVTDWYQFFWE